MDSGVHGENSSFQNGNQYILSISTKEAAGGMWKITYTGGFFFVPPRLCEEMALAEGMPVSGELLSQLQFHHQIYTAYRKSIDLLSRKDHSRQMLALKLRQRDYPPPVITAVLQRLAEEHIVDDREFGQHYLQFLLRKKKYGRGKLTAKLREKGLSRELSEGLLAGVGDFEEEDALRKSAEKLYRKTNMTEEKMARSLIRRGFPPSKVYACITEYFSF